MYLYGKTTLFLLLILLLGGCGSNTSITYVHGLPQSESPALTEFLEHLITSFDDSKLYNKDGQFIFSKGNLVERQNSVHYYHYTENQLLTFYDPLFKTNNYSLKLNELRNSDDLLELRQPLENTEAYSLPRIKINTNNQLKIETSYNQATFDLSKVLEDYKIANDTQLIVNIIAVSEENILLTLNTSLTSGISTYLFIDQRLSDYTVTQFHQEDPQQVIQEKLTPYYDLFPTVNEYRSVLGSTIVNTETNEAFPLQEEDLLSVDGKYVYLGGEMKKPSEDLEDGTQRIQTIENYAKGNEVYEEDFHIDYGQISDQLDFDTKNIITADIVYFNADYVVLDLLYAGRFVGHGGSTNVLIDLQKEENPTAYLVDLGLQ
ncbi:hypothetical protein F9U64_16645 [Gracilibacillus oryzae]|uniref:Uncharacterized protein n=1 Tax=Gracilibacillus oryzae TaxID=1672701 RepID=A0A7C8GRR9_9BACI|nr:hypothetical protein [Gracilibacillus oryzae]KAB8128321.1 hypothetical protein F9U64_16645 [Gracilibacillus oryzae]